MKRLAFAGCLMVALVLSAGAAWAEPVQGHTSLARALSLAALLQGDDWTTEGGDPEEAEEPAEEGGDHTDLVEEARLYPPANRPGPRQKYHDWQQRRLQAQQDKRNKYNALYDRRFRGRPKRFSIKVGGEIASLGSGDAGGWTTYAGHNPGFDDLFEHGFGVALEGSVRLVPFFELAGGIAYTSLDGQSERVSTGSWIDMDDMSVTNFWVGPKLTFPLGLSPRLWGSQTGLRDAQAYNLYLMPACIGFSILSDAWAEYMGADFEYFSRDVDFFYSLRGGFEMHFGGIGAYLELGLSVHGGPEGWDLPPLDTEAGILTALFAQAGVFFCF